MRDPYEVLGVSRNASTDEVKNAYRALAKKYHPDQYAGSPLQENANKKMKEINEAYDAIISGNAGSYRSSGYSNSFNDSVYAEVNKFMSERRIDEAETVLESVSENLRDAKWYYLKGQVNYNRGWTDQAYTYFTIAYKMEPGNAQYRSACENLGRQRSGGFRTSTGRHNSGRSSDCDGCDLCCGLMCADSCCECCGCDIIPCC